MGIKNKLSHLNDHLFEQLETLNDTSLKGEDLKQEVERAKSMGFLASQIIANANLVLKAAEFFNEAKILKTPDIFQLEETND